MPETIDSLVDEIPSLKRFAHSLIRGRSGADDLVQDTLERAIQKFHLYQPETRLRYWLFTVMRNIFYDQCRRGEKEKALAREMTAEISVHSLPSQIAKLAHRDMVHQFGALKDEYRTLLMLVALDGVSYEEAAELTGVPLGTVRSRLYRARNILSHELEGAPVRTLEGCKKATRADVPRPDRMGFRSPTGARAGRSLMSASPAQAPQ